MKMDKNFMFCKFVKFSSFLGVWISVETIKAKTWLEYWFIKSECLKVLILHFSGNFHAWMHIHVKLLQS